jgi:hypothetical protein
MLQVLTLRFFSIGGRFRPFCICVYKWPVGFQGSSFLVIRCQDGKFTFWLPRMLSKIALFLRILSVRFVYYTCCVHSVVVEQQHFVIGYQWLCWTKLSLNVNHYVAWEPSTPITSYCHLVLLILLTSPTLICWCPMSQHSLKFTLLQSNWWNYWIMENPLILRLKSMCCCCNKYYVGRIYIWSCSNRRIVSDLWMG